MVAAQVIGNDATITIGGQSGNFQLNDAAVIAYNLPVASICSRTLRVNLPTRPLPDSRFIATTSTVR
jgi:aspartate ammonia-lyase